MSTCSVCHGRATLQICEICFSNFRDSLSQLPWMMRELITTRCRQDRLNLGIVGGRSSDTPSPIHWGASRMIEEVSSLVQMWVEWLCESNNIICWGDPLMWLMTHIDMVPRHQKAEEIVKGVYDLAGNPDKPSESCRILRILNRNLKVFAGTCPNLLGHNRLGEEVRCGRILYADEDQLETTCPNCEFTVSVAENRSRTVADRDILPATKILEIMETLGEDLTKETLYGWTRTGRLTAQAYLHQGVIVEHRVRRTDPALYSLNTTRRLRELVSLSP